MNCFGPVCSSTKYAYHLHELFDQWCRESVFQCCFPILRIILFRLGNYFVSCVFGTFLRIVLIAVVVIPHARILQSNYLVNGAENLCFSVVFPVI
jgi:hypothetical protein